MDRVYLDYAATAPLLPHVAKNIEQLLSTPLGNPSSLHAEGRAARHLLDTAHTEVGYAFGVQPTEVIFTSGATESNHLALAGILNAWRLEHPDVRPHIVTTPLEHASWREAVASADADVTVVPPKSSGAVDPKQVLNSITAATALVSIMYVNNETGAVQPVPEIGKAIVARRTDSTTAWPQFHTDAVQAFPYLNCHIGHTHADLMTFSSHKYGGLSGAGILIARRHTPLTSVLRGGGQEWGKRAGTENIVGIVAAGSAVAYQYDHASRTTRHAASVQHALESMVRAKLPNVSITASQSPRAPHISHLLLPDNTDATTIAQRLDLAGFAVSTGPACSSGATEPSSTLLAMGLSEAKSRSGLRISYGYGTTEPTALKIVPILAKMLAD